MVVCTCQPATQFCCGCSTAFGVKLILYLHLLQSAFFILMTTGDIIFKEHSYSISSKSGFEILVTAYALAGLPIILLGLYGVYQRLEVHVRFYFYYMILSVLLDMIYVSYSVAILWHCKSSGGGVGGLMGGDSAGAAFGCGAARGMSMIFVSMAAISQLYMVFVVFSYCEDLNQSGGGKALSELSYYKEAAYLKQKKGDAYNSILGLGEHQPGEYGSVYETAASSGLGGGKSLFGGNMHELAYPPPAMASNQQARTGGKGSTLGLGFV